MWLPYGVINYNTEDGEQRVPAYFCSHVQDIDSSNGLDRDALVADLAAQVDDWNSRGSGFVMERITNFILVLNEISPTMWQHVPRNPTLASQ